MTDPAYIASTAGGRVVDYFHTDADCRLGPSEQSQREITTGEAKQRELELCSVCGDTVESKDNDPYKYIRKLQNHEP